MNETKSIAREGMQIDLQKLLFAWLKKWWLILICVAVGLGGTYYYTTHYITPMYRATVTIYVNNSSADEHIDYITGSNLSASQQLVTTYVNMIKSDSVLRKVAEAVNEPKVTASYIRKELTASQVQSTVMFNVYIADADPRRAATIANTIADIAPAQIAEFVEGSSTKIVDYALIPQSPYTPNVARNTLIGGVVGLLLALLIITLNFLLDVRIKEEDDLTSLFNLPILGQIPYIEVRTPTKRIGSRRGDSEND